MNNSFITKCTIQLALLILIIVLAACGPITPSRPTESLVSPTTIATETYTPTAMQTQILETPTVTATATKTEAPAPEYATSADKLNDMTLVDSLKPVQQYALNHRVLNNPVTLGFEPVHKGRYANSAQLECLMGTNCVERYFVRTKDPANGVDRWYVILEVRNPGDDQSHILTLYIGSDDSGNDLLIGAQRNLDELNKMKTNGSDGILDIAALLEPYGISNPAIKDMYAHLSPEEIAALKVFLQNGTISDALSYTSLWLVDQGIR